MFSMRIMSLCLYIGVAWLGVELGDLAGPGVSTRLDFGIPLQKSGLAFIGCKSDLLYETILVNAEYSTDILELLFGNAKIPHPPEP